MILSQAAQSWGSAEFEAALKQEIKQLDKSLLPLQQGLTIGSYVSDDELDIVFIKATEEGTRIQAKLGICYCSTIAGCSCADDPTPVDVNSEYCEVVVEIDRETGEGRVELVVD
jgi:hypothetical protein